MSEPTHSSHTPTPTIPAPTARGPHAEVDRLLDQLARATDDEAWHGPSLFPLLAPLSAEVAVRRPLPSRHTIWELTVHLTAWTDIARRAIQGERFDVTPEMDWPAIADTSEPAWRATVDTLHASWRALQTVVESLDDQALRKRPPGRPYTVYSLLLGVIQHVAYHAGQIALLR